MNNTYADYPLPMNNTYADAICDQLTIHADLSATKKKEEENAKKYSPVPRQRAV